MTTSTSTSTTSGGTRPGESLVNRLRTAIDPTAHRPGPGPSSEGWLAVTVLREPSELDGTALPAPLADFGDRIEVRLRPAPGGRGTEVAARLRNQQGAGTAVDRLRGGDPASGLRSALRRAKQLIEVGEVLAVDPAPHGNRTGTPAGRLLEAWTRVAHEGGLR